MNTFFEKAGKVIVNYLPAIMTGASIAMHGWAIAMAIAATPRAEIHIYDKKKELETDKLTVRQTVEACWKDYIPAASAFFAGSALSVGSLSVVNRRLATLSASYQIKEALNGEYREKVRELVGPEKEAEVAKDAQRNYISKYDADEIVERLPSKEDKDLYCLNGRYFYSTRNRIDAIVNRINQRLLSGDDMSMNEIYDEFGTQASPSPMHGRGVDDYNGFSAENEKTGRPDQVEIGYEPAISRDGKACQSIYFVVGPHRLGGGY